MFNGKATIILLTVGLIKEISLYKISLCPEPDACNQKEINVKSDLPNQATKSGLKGATGVDTSKFAKKADLVSLKSNIYE